MVKPSLQDSLQRVLPSKTARSFGVSCRESSTPWRHSLVRGCPLCRAKRIVELLHHLNACLCHFNGLVWLVRIEGALSEPGKDSEHPMLLPSTKLSGPIEPLAMSSTGMLSIGTKSSENRLAHKTGRATMKDPWFQRCSQPNTKREGGSECSESRVYRG